MTIKRATISEMFEEGLSNRPQLIRLDQRFAGSSSTCKRKTIGWWTTEEHDKFLEAMELYPSGPWKKIARHVGSRTPRQVMTHAQKYRQRIQRRKNRSPRRTLARTELVLAKEIRANEDTMDIPAASTNDKPAAIESLSAEEAEVFELLFHSPVCEEICDEIQILDFLLLDEMLELNIPTIYSESALPEQLDDDELVEILSDPMLTASP
ncbi:hypothetical protein PRNP1_001084 [Phytophthora ramorum]